jgi:hypothetical protein
MLILHFCPKFTVPVPAPFSLSIYFLRSVDPDSIEFRTGSRGLMIKNSPQLTIFFLLIKNCNLLIPRLHKGRPSYRNSLQPSKENIPHFKKFNLLTFSIFVDHFCPPGYRLQIRIRIQAPPLIPDPDPQHCL